MEDILLQYMTILIGQFQWDVAQMSQAWMYYWLLVPITCFVFFFVTKWMLLTAPLWVPFVLILQASRRK